MEHRAQQIGKQHTKAINVDRNLAEAHNNLGVLYARMNLYDKAREHFQLAVQFKPENKNYAQNLALLNEQGQPSAPAINCPQLSKLIKMTLLLN